MSTKNKNLVEPFLKAFSPGVQKVAIDLRQYILKLFPESVELIYDSYNALALAFSLTDKLSDSYCSIAVYTNHVNLGFNRGTELQDNQKILSGKGSLYRHITIDNQNIYDEEINSLLFAAHANAIRRCKSLDNRFQGKTIIKSLSQNKKARISTNR